MFLKFSNLPTLLNLSNFLLLLLFLLALISLISLNSLHSLTFQFSVFSFHLSVFTFHLSSSSNKQPSWLDTNSAVCYFHLLCVIPPSIY